MKIGDLLLREQESYDGIYYNVGVILDAQPEMHDLYQVFWYTGAVGENPQWFLERVVKSWYKVAQRFLNKPR